MREVVTSSSFSGEVLLQNNLRVHKTLSSEQDSPNNLNEIILIYLYNTTSTTVDYNVHSEYYCVVVLHSAVRYITVCRCSAPASSFNPPTARPESRETASFRSSTVAVSKSSVISPLCCPTTRRVMALWWCCTLSLSLLRPMAFSIILFIYYCCNTECLLLYLLLLF